MILAVCAALTARADDKQDFQTIARGRYLTTMGDCAACHTAPDGQPFAGGRAIETPFGSVLSANITPDRTSGIGAWSDQDFVDALQKGRGRDGRHLYPAMPYTYTAEVSRDDALAIRAYLATLPPVNRKIVGNQLPFPFNIRAVIGVWNRLFFKKGSFKPDEGKSAEWNRGAYLVQGLEHCGMCHTPKNMLGGDRDGELLEGYRLQDWFAPNITNDARRGLGTWSVDDIVAYLRAGHNRVAAASGPMGEEVERSSQYASEADLRAIAAYLKDPPSAGATAPPGESGASPKMAGAAIYADLCSACHTPSGAGVADLFPMLAGAPAVQSVDPTSVIRVILRGSRSVATSRAPTGPAMPSFAWELDDAKVAAVATYVRSAWGNVAPAVTPSRVASEREALARRAGD